MDRWVTFDCFGTLVDWRRGLRAALAQYVGAPQADDLLLAALAAAWSLEIGPPHHSYRHVLVESVRVACGERGLSHVPADLFLQAWPSLPLFSDVPPCLARLKDEGWRLAVLTNCDDDLFDTVAASLGVELDELVTSQRVGSYKPAHGHFEVLRRVSGGAPWVHVANSWWADIRPAHALGIPSVWVNRDHDDNDPTLARTVVFDLEGLDETLHSIAAALD